MMHWGESIRFAGRALAADKVKAFLTMLGITIGATSIVLVVTIIASGREYITAQIEGIGSNLAYAELERSGEKTIPQDEITPADLAAVRAALPMVVAAAGSYDVNAEVVVRGMPHRTRLVGVTEDFQRIRNLRITSGRYFDLEDFSSRDKVCLVTDKFARTAFGSEAALGNTVQLGQFRCTVIGTFREGVPTFGQSEIQDQTVLVPFPLTRVMTGDNFFQVIYTQADDAGEVPRMTSELLRLLHQRHRPEANYYVQNLGSLLETAKKASIAMTGVLLAIAILMLTTAGTGIMNIMLVNVAERTKEIGIRKALGATMQEIRAQFLLEAAFIAGAGGITGIAIAVALIWSAAGLLEGMIPIGISWMSVVAALLLPTGIGVLFGYRPASQAAEMNPIDALRSD